MRWVLAIAVTVGLALATAAAAGPSMPRVLVEVDRLEGFAQDGNRIAWVDTALAKGCNGLVKERDLRTGKTWSIYRTARGDSCDSLGETQGFQHSMALAGDRAMWALVSAGLSHYGFRVQTAGVHAPLRDLSFQETSGGSDGPFRPVPFAGDGPTLLYVDQSEPGPRYVLRVDGSRVAGSYGTLSLGADGQLFAAGRRELGGCLCNFDPAVSPDETRIVYSSGRVPGGMQAGRGWFTARVDGTGGERQLPAADYLRWSGDGRWLVGSADGWAVRISPDTGAVARISKGDSVDWSPDGKRVLYYADRAQLWVTGPSLGKVRIGDAPRAIWSPDSSRLLLHDGSGALWVAEAATGARRLVARDVGNETWSPDGTMVAFSTSTAMFVAAVAGGSPRLIHSGPGWYLWSPDSRRLAVGGDSHVWLVSALDGSSLDLGATGEVGQMEWSPASAAISYVRQGAASYEVFVATLDGRIQPLGRGDRTVWSPDGGRLLIGEDVEDGARSSYATRLVSLDGAASKPLPDASPIAWLPSGKVLLRVGTIDAWSEDGDLEVVDANLANPLLLTHTVPAPPWRGVEIRRTATGAIASRITVGGDPVAVALNSGRVAVIVEVNKRHRLEIRTVSGKPVRSIAVPRNVTAVSLSPRWAVFQTGMLIQALDITTGRVRTVARATGVTLGVSIEGTRVAWGEWRKKGGNAILAVDLPH